MRDYAGSTRGYTFDSVVEEEKARDGGGLELCQRRDILENRANVV
jgi:hypothetical protein